MAGTATKSAVGAKSGEQEVSNSNEPILSRLQPAKGAVRPKKRKGRGPGSGLGKTAGKGQKGQKARSPGNFSKLGFEGGQMPLQRRLPKMGFWNPFRKEIAIVNVRDLARFDANASVNLDSLKAKRLVRPKTKLVKVLGNGTLDRPLSVEAHAFSKTAEEKIKQAGGKVEVLSKS